MSNRAWVTLATNDSYGLGALVLANSLRRTGSTYPAVVLITPSVTEAMRDRLRAVFAEVVTVDVLDSGDAAHLALLQRPELGITFTKIHCWSLTQYEKCVFLDADTLVVQNCDELFDREQLSAAPDVGWPDCFNSGVFVFSPSQETFNELIKFAQERGSFDGGDQGLLNSFFSDWAHGDISKHLPFLYNVTSAAFYSYLPALKHYGQNLKIIHFIGAAKPWLQQFNWESRTVEAPDHLREFLQLWWDLFVAQVHSNLDISMVEVEDAPPALLPQDVSQHFYYQPLVDPESEFPWHHPDAQIQDETEHSEIDMTDIHDPWELYRGHIPPSKDDTTGHHAELRKYAWEYQSQSNEEYVPEAHNQQMDQSYNEHGSCESYQHSEQFYDCHSPHEHTEYTYNEPQHIHSHDYQYDHSNQEPHQSHKHFHQQSSEDDYEHNKTQEQHYYKHTYSDNEQPQYENPHDHQHYHHEHHHYPNHHDPNHHDPNHHDFNDHNNYHDSSHQLQDTSSHVQHEIRYTDTIIQPQTLTHFQKDSDHLKLTYSQQQQTVINHTHIEHNTSREDIDIQNNNKNIMNGDAYESDDEFHEELQPRHPYDEFYLKHRVTIDPYGRKICTHEIPPKTPTPSPPSSPSPEPSLLLECPNENVHESDVEDQSGVAGNLARVVPGAASQREALDELTRRQGWEAGNIDYMGADSFANIWAKISQTLNQPRQSPPKESPPPQVQPQPEPVEVAKEVLPVETAPAPVETAPAPVEPTPVVIPAPVETKPPVESPALTKVSAPAPVQADALAESVEAPVAAPAPSPVKVAAPSPAEVTPTPAIPLPTVAPTEIPIPVEKLIAKDLSEAKTAEKPEAKTESVVPQAVATAVPVTAQKEVQKPVPVEAPKVDVKAPPSPARASEAPGSPAAAVQSKATPEKLAAGTESPPLAHTPSKEEAPAVPAAKLEVRRKPAGKLKLSPPAVADPLPTPDSELEDAASLAQSIIASELRTPTVTSPEPQAPAIPSPPAQEKRLSVEAPQVPTPPVGAVSLAQIGVKPGKEKSSTAALIESSVTEPASPTTPSTPTPSGAPAPTDVPKKKIIKKVVKKESGGEAPVPPPRKKEKKPKEK